jgi:hypothetical protein
MADVASIGDRPCVLVTPASLCERRDLLAPVGHEINFVFHPQTVPADMSGYVGVVLGNEEFGSAAFATADRLRLVARYGGDGPQRGSGVGARAWRGRDTLPARVSVRSGGVHCRLDLPLRQGTGPRSTVRFCRRHDGYTVRRYVAGTVWGCQEKTPGALGSAVTRSQLTAVSPNVSSRVRLGTPA